MPHRLPARGAPLARGTGPSARDYGGPYTITAARGFSLGERHVTEMGGSDDVLRAESLYLDLLRQARTYQMTMTTLTLKNAGNQDILVFAMR
ncbi:MAG: META domain-containing protein [Gemmatimonas sp.]